MRREFPDAPIVGVGAVVLDGDRILLVRRGRAPLKGEWSIPGGALELGETLEAGVQREVAEETGVRVKVLGIVEVLDRIVPEEDGTSIESGLAARRVRYHYVLIDFLCASLGGDLCCGSDAADACWVARGELATYGLAQITVSVIEKAFEMRDAS